jgi:hypothetical protein
MAGTCISFEPNAQVVLDGKTLEMGSRKEYFDPNFKMNVVKLSGKTQYIQKVKTLGDITTVTGKLIFMTCNGEMCMPPKKIEFKVPLAR